MNNVFNKYKSILNPPRKQFYLPVRSKNFPWDIKLALFPQIKCIVHAPNAVKFLFYSYFNHQTHRFYTSLNMDDVE